MGSLHSWWRAVISRTPSGFLRRSLLACIEESMDWLVKSPLPSVLISVKTLVSITKFALRCFVSSISSSARPGLVGGYRAPVSIWWMPCLSSSSRSNSTDWESWKSVISMPKEAVPKMSCIGVLWMRVRKEFSCYVTVNGYGIKQHEDWRELLCSLIRDRRTYIPMESMFPIINQSATAGQHPEKE